MEFGANWMRFFGVSPAVSFVAFKGKDLGSTSLDDIMLSVPLAGWKELMLSLYE